MPYKNVTSYDSYVRFYCIPRVLCTYKVSWIVLIFDKDRWVLLIIKPHRNNNNEKNLSKKIRPWVF